MWIINCSVGKPTETSTFVAYMCVWFLKLVCVYSRLLKGLQEVWDEDGWWLSHHLLWHNGDEALRFEYRTTNSTTDFRYDVEYMARRGWEQYNHVERAVIQISASAVCTALCLWKCSEQLEASALKYYLCPSIAFMHILFTFNVNT